MFLMSLGRSWVISEAKIHSKALSRTCDDFEIFILELYKYLLTTWTIVNIQFLLNELHPLFVILVRRIYFLSRQFLFCKWLRTDIKWDFDLRSYVITSFMQTYDPYLTTVPVSYWYHISKTCSFILKMAKL